MPIDALPMRSGDPSRVSVRVVASGTGEHMMRTTACARVCDRLYDNLHRDPLTGRLMACNEEEVIWRWVRQEFMGHPAMMMPSVSPTTTASATASAAQDPAQVQAQTQAQSAVVGILALKCENGGVRLHYAHNSSSFVIGSQTSLENGPSSCMSRRMERAPVAFGMRVLRREDPG